MTLYMSLAIAIHGMLKSTFKWRKQRRKQRKKQKGRHVTRCEHATTAKQVNACRKFAHGSRVRAEKTLQKRANKNQVQKQASHMDTAKDDTQNARVTAPMLTQREAASPTTPIGGGA